MYLAVLAARDLGHVGWLHRLDILIYKHIASRKMTAADDFGL